jgi:hypothetical protein
MNAWREDGRNEADVSNWTDTKTEDDVILERGLS